MSHTIAATFEKTRGECTLCNPFDELGHGVRDVVRVVPGVDLEVIGDDVLICQRCAQTIFETWRDGARRYVSDDPALVGMTGTVYKPKGKRS